MTLLSLGPAALPADVALVRFRRRHDEASFRALYAAHTPYLWALALRLSGRRDAEAEEILQEAWIRAVERLDRFRGESSLRTWLGGILVNCWRERRRELAWEEGELPEELPAREAARPLEALDLERALAALPDGLRAVVLLHDVAGFTHLEIAERLEIAAGTSKSRLFAARRRLAARLSDG
jgi:RNA polymerase sigma-70 factor (ECF subfamily)